MQQLRPSNPLISRLHTAVVRRQGTRSRSAVRVQANGSGLKIDLTGELMYKSELCMFSTSNHAGCFRWSILIVQMALRSPH
jgi:hypothetical protein